MQKNILPTSLLISLQEKNFKEIKTIYHCLEDSNKLYFKVYLLLHLNELHSELKIGKNLSWIICMNKGLSELLSTQNYSLKGLIYMCIVHHTLFKDNQEEGLKYVRWQIMNSYLINLSFDAWSRILNVLNNNWKMSFSNFLPLNQSFFENKHFMIEEMFNCLNPTINFFEHNHKNYLFSFNQILQLHQF